MGAGNGAYEEAKRKMEQNIDRLLHQEVRVATNLNEVQADKQQFYSMEETEKDKELIDHVLFHRTRLHLSDEDTYRLQAIQGRNISHLLLNQQKFTGDSTEMKEVKKDVATLERLLSQPWNAETAESAVSDIESAYQMAIASCQYYIDNKHSTFQTGIERKMMVWETLDHLREEAKQISVAKKLIKEGQLTGEVTTARDLLVQAHEYMAAHKEQPAEKRREQPTGINALTYADFAAMLGTHNRGQIEFSGKGLQLINNGIFSTSTGTVSAANYQVRERFLAVVLEKLGAQATPDIMLRLQTTLGLSKGATEAAPLSRHTLYDVITEINLRTSAVSQTLAEGKNAPASRHRLALTATELFSAQLDDRSQTYATAAQEQMMKTQIATILGNAKRLGVNVPGLSKHQMDNLVKGNILLLRDNIFHVLSRTYDAMRHLNGGNETDFSRLAGNKDAVNKLAAYTILKMAAVSEEGRAAAEHDLNLCITNTAFEFCGQKGLQDDFDRAHAGMLASKGSEGLDQTVEARIPTCAAWKKDRKKMKLGFDNLGSLCDKLSRIAAFERKAFNSGLTGDEAAELKQLGTDVERMFQKDELGSNAIADAMNFVAGELKGTRFSEGFAQVKTRIEKDGFSFKQATERIANATTIQQVQQENLSQNVQKDIQREPDRQGWMAKVTEEAQRLLGTLNQEAKDAVSMLLLIRTPSELIKEPNDAVSRDLVALRKALRKFSAGKLSVENIQFAGLPLQLVHKENDLLELVIDHQTIPLPYNASLIADHLEADMMANTALFETENARAIIDSLKPVEENSGEIVRTRNLCLRLLESKTGKPASFFNNVSTEKIRDYASCLVTGDLSAQSIIHEVDLIENKQLINNEEALALLRKMEQKRKNKEAINVTILPKEEEDEPGWLDEEEQIKNFLADLVYSKETWETDAKLGQPVVPGMRIKNLLSKNRELFFLILRKPEILDDMLDKLPLPERTIVKPTVSEQRLRGKIRFKKGSVKKHLKEKLQKEKNMRHSMTVDIKADIRNSIHRFLEIPEIRELQKDALTDGMMAKFKLNTKLGAALVLPSTNELFAELEDQIENGVKNSMYAIQEMINGSVDKIFQSDETKTNTPLLDPNEPGINKKEKKKRRKAISKRLKEMAAESVSGKRGQGLFIRNILQHYFSDVPLMDQRAMVASAIRNAKPVAESSDNPSKAETKKAERKAAGSYLGGIMKGAGPLLQKLLQGLPIDSMPEELQSALKDMRSNLAPIPDEIVEAQMEGIIERSNGKITDITVMRSLGAASVGQAFLCKINGPDLPQDGQEVVIKLLRPDVRNHMMREKDLMLKYARMTDEQSRQQPGQAPVHLAKDEKGGMQYTYEGQLLRIEEELDLTKEAQKVEQGRIYDTGYERVKAVKVNPLVEPTANALVLEKAPGTTVDKYLAEMRKIYQDTIAPFYKRNEKGEPIVDEEKHEMIVTSANQVHLAKTRVALADLHAQLVKRQKYLAEIARKWSLEGIYGKGFYHGDMHAGNMMINDDGLTIIDFGNATQLTDAQQSLIMRLMNSAANGFVNDFRHNFHLLLENTPDEIYQAKREELGRIIEEIFAMGTEKDAGARIAVVLLKAQELGLEIPTAIANFSQSQLRLQNTIDEMNTLITSIGKDIEGLVDINADIATSTIDIQLKYHKMSVDTADYINTYGMHEIPDISREVFLSAVRGKTEEERKTFDEKYMMFSTETETFAQFCSLLTDKLKEIAAHKDDAKIVDEAKQNLEKNIPTTLQKLRSFLGGKAEVELDNIERELGECMEHPEEEASLKKAEEISKIILELAETPGRLLKELRAAQDQKDTPPEELAQKEQAFYAAYNPAFLSCLYFRNPDLNNILSQFDLQDTDTLQKINDELKNWFADETNYGPQLREAYTRFRDAEAAQSADLTEAKNNFLYLFVQASSHRMAELMKVLKKKVNTEYDPNSFFDVMSSIISENCAASISRLGLKLGSIATAQALKHIVTDSKLYQKVFGSNDDDDDDNNDE